MKHSSFLKVKGNQIYVGDKHGNRGIQFIFNWYVKEIINLISSTDLFLKKTKTQRRMCEYLCNNAAKDVPIDSQNTP